ncbi:CBF1-interacting co-repressor CIR N-terminal domain-containing protein [Dioscorea alata]|uniref:CBF1-interacting co-repressor CIR N-terminal domain-containing protein n=2 Tax=Dioscorea alata TaxID=55571 RepID=A0ACB7WIU0_DIOAL|nr:CBF1-interacting co-repressor CIR N-terminal domain-containing protein [Dioscorea alata]KAH7687687.1 CBF1-interacting co-repressor CIR N-terminal domain-containing protein [Dioscorea alata]
MGGHGGLNILPQKRWNVYNYENREKVRKDEEAAAKEEQLKREQSRRRDAELRLERLRQARNLPNPNPNPKPSYSHHINLFESLPDFNFESQPKTKKIEDERPRDLKKRRREEPPAVGPEEEKYKLGYGLVGKGVKAPWYVSGASLFSSEDGDGGRGSVNGAETSTKKSGGKKTIEEMREERMRREKREKEKEIKLISSVARESNKGFSRRRS